ncbi:MAG: hypothetical protein ACIARR_02515 [Phycisphaerales bacterium JB059]
MPPNRKTPPRAEPDLFASPALFPRQFDFAQRVALLVRMTRDTYRDSTFLDERTKVADPRALTVPIQALHTRAQRDARPNPPVNYIFHTAFCGSTLLSRCLELPGISFALKEPAPLHQLACIRRDIVAKLPTPVPVDQPLFDASLAVATALLARTWSPGEIALIKPSDTCNNLIRPILDASDQSRAILLYSRIDDFVVAMLKNDKRRNYVAGMLPRARVDLMGALDDVQTDALSPAQTAAYVWLGQIRTYLNELGANPGRSATLDGALIFSRPAEVVRAVANQFRLNLADRTLRRIVEGPVFNADSKDPTKPFDHQAYQQQRARTKAALEPEILEARRWLDAHAGAINLPDELPNPALA